MRRFISATILVERGFSYSAVTEKETDNMRILWIAGLGAVLVTGGVSAQGMNTTPGSTPATMNERALERSPANEADDILRAQNPQLPARGERTQRAIGPRPIAPMNERALERSPANESDDILRAQNPQQQPRDRANQSPRSSDANTGRTRDRGVSARPRDNPPRDAASRAYMGGGLILEDGRPVAMPGDPPGAASDFRGENVEQSTARGQRRNTGMGGDMVERPQPNRPQTNTGQTGAQTNVGQTGAEGRGTSGTSQGAFPANPPTPGGRVPTQ